MKRLSLLCVLLAAASGCKTRSGEEFEPTRPGFYLYEQCADPLLETLNDAWLVLAFARYYETTDAAEREELHDLFFYTQRIVCDDGGCRIICDRYELAIDTGGVPLSDPDACWSYRYEGRTYPDGLPTLRADAGGDPSCCRLRLPASQRPRTLSGEWTIETHFESSVTAPGTTVQSLVLSLNGSGKVLAPDIAIDCQTLEPLVYRSSSQLIERGGLHLEASTTEAPRTAEAFIETPHRVRIVYNGHQKTWSTHEYYFCYE